MGSLHPYFGVYNKLQLCIILQKERKEEIKERGGGRKEGRGKRRKKGMWSEKEKKKNPQGGKI